MGGAAAEETDGERGGEEPPDLRRGNRGRRRRRLTCRRSWSRRSWGRPCDLKGPGTTRRSSGWGQTRPSRPSAPTSCSCVPGPAGTCPAAHTGDSRRDWASVSWARLPPPAPRLPAPLLPLLLRTHASARSCRCPEEPRQYARCDRVRFWLSYFIVLCLVGKGKDYA